MIPPPSLSTVFKQFVFLGLLSPLSQVASAQLNLFPYAFPDDQSYCQAFSEDVSPAQQEVINELMAAQPHRLYHFLWHATRNGWSSLRPDEQVAIQQLSPEWGRSAPLCPAPPGTQSTGYNPAGEEFLRMHHMMIDQLRTALIQRGLPCIAGWNQIPTSDDPLWPVPASADPNDSSKSAAMERLLQVWSQTFMSAAFLQTHTLSEVGYLIEFSIHNNMHMRWAAAPRPGDDFSPLANSGVGVLNAAILLTPTQFSSPAYNWLGNPFSSQVNPVFWKLHGWIDHVISEWLHVNGMVSISAQCTPGDKLCYPWQSQWLGAPMMMMMSAGGPAGGGAPVGGGMPPSMGDMSGDISGELGQSLSKIAPAATFRNSKFDHFLSEPRGGAGPGGGVDPLSEYNDPSEFVRQFGPCARGQ